MRSLSGPQRRFVEEATILMITGCVLAIFPFVFNPVDVASGIDDKSWAKTDVDCTALLTVVSDGLSFKMVGVRGGAIFVPVGVVADMLGMQILRCRYFRSHLHQVK